MYLYIKAIHILFVVTWFAGLFYFPRLLIYYVEANQKTVEERAVLQNQFKIMMSRLWFGITWPSAILTLLFGSWMFTQYPAFEIWLKVKILLVALLYAYHFSLHFIYKKLLTNSEAFSSTFLRMWNEVATLFLVAIIFLVELKNTADMFWGLIGMVALVVLLMFSIKAYKKIRNS